ncbi:MAG: D-proline reductase (dithiol) PrdB [Hyphomicrobiaceae bacterium]|jgi:D-proline reductase (dithiol) PrdB
MISARSIGDVSQTTLATTLALVQAFRHHTTDRRPTCSRAIQLKEPPVVRLADLPTVDANHLLAKNTYQFDTQPFVDGPPLSKRRVAIISTAGLHPAGQDNFNLRDTGYRAIPGAYNADELVMSHASVNFDRTGFQQDINIVFPIDRLRELEAENAIGSVADCHYSFMGAGWEPKEIEASCNQLAGLLKEDQVNAALLVPV